ncbi:MAG: hypothetical protein FWH19_02335 [Treponema sp.]|nr:hypothetical protein [Treponema sp.]
MVRKTDLFSILVSYAKRINSPQIDVDSFLEYFEKYAKKYAAQQPDLLQWIENDAEKFWSEVDVLSQAGKCEFFTEKSTNRLFVPIFFAEKVNDAYKNPDEDANLPFYSEESLKIILPEKQVKHVNLEYGFIAYLEESYKDPPKSDLPVIRIKFPDDFGHALLLSRMIPRRLGEIAFLKVRAYLRRQKNKEFAVSRLKPQLPGKDEYIMNQINQVLYRPLECYKDIAEGRGTSFLFWSYFCNLVKKDVREKKEFFEEDYAVIQSVFFIELLNGYHNALAIKQREREHALACLERLLAKSPYAYTIGQILQFKDPKGNLLLGLYAKEDLDAWIKEKTKSSHSMLPELLVVQDANSMELIFIKKEKMLSYCVHLLTESRFMVKDAVSKHWRRLIAEFKNEPAMDKDDEFELLLYKFADKLCPSLMTLLADPKVALVHEEAEREMGSLPSALKIFEKGKLLPYSILFNLRRKEALNDAKLALPFWYSIPIIGGIIAFFKGLGGKKKKRKSKTAGDEEQVVLEEKDRAKDVRAAAEDMEVSLVPAGYTIEEYLEELQSRWLKLINPQTRANVLEDVHFLIKNKLRSYLKVNRNAVPTQEALADLALTTVNSNPALSCLSGKSHLVLYLQLYMVKALGNIR